MVSSTSQPPRSVEGHRMRWYLLLLAIAIGLAIAAVVGILLSTGNSEPKPPPVPTAQGRTLASASVAVVRSAAGVGSIENSTVAVSPGAGWSLAKKSAFSLLLLNPRKTGLLGLESGPLKNPNVVQYAQALTNSILQGTTNAKICGKIQKVTVPRGPTGLGIPLCYTIVPQNGQAIQLYTVLLAGVSGRVGVATKFITPASSAVFKAFLGDASPVLGTLVWKLL